MPRGSWLLAGAADGVLAATWTAAPTGTTAATALEYAL
jgi:hypothetical protein